MKIFEVVFWGSHGRGDSEDTIYLVRAPDFKAAIQDVQWNGAPIQNGTRSDDPDVVYELGVDSSPYADANPRILRGPYFAHAFNAGWNAWMRNEEENDYIEEKIEDRN